MQDDQNKNPQKDDTPDERPIDPTQNAEDTMGDLTGRSGATQGSAPQTSAEPDDVSKDTSTIRGGVLNTPSDTEPSGEDRTSKENSEFYDEAVQKGMSQTRTNASLDNATEDEHHTNQPSSQGGQNDTRAYQNPIPGQSSDTPLSEMPTDQPHVEGEMDSAGGSADHPETDSDVDEMNKRTIGNSPDQGEEIPNLAEEIDKDEEAIRES